MSTITVPSKLALDRERGELELQFNDQRYCLSAEFLRVHSPSAEVQGHGPGQKKTPINKDQVKLTNIEAQGNYAVKLIFDDGHDSGIYTWSYLHDLCLNQEKHWSQYLTDAKIVRDQQAGIGAIKWVDASE